MFCDSGVTRGMPEAGRIGTHGMNRLRISDVQERKQTVLKCTRLEQGLPESAAIGAANRGGKRGGKDSGTLNACR
jgi:hypothetical protein